MKTLIQYLLPGWLGIATLLLTACDGGAVGDIPTPSIGGNDPIATALQAFGVDTSQTSRVDNDQDPLPESYAPFGKVKTFNKTDELLLLGFELAPSFGLKSHLLSIVKAVPDKKNNVDTLSAEPQFVSDKADTPWALAGTDQFRAASSADIDGDGIDEIIVTYKKSGEDIVYLVTYNDKTAGFTKSEPLVISNTAVTDLGIAAGDFDGDGLTDVVIVETQAGTARLVFLKNQAGALALSGKEILLPQAISGSRLQIAIAVGNIDYDAADEIAVVVNERFKKDGHDYGDHQYFIYDDGLTQFKQLSTGKLRANTGSPKTALTAGVSIGDVDADAVGEIVFAGLTNFDPDSTCGYAYLTLVLDDAKRDLAELAAHYQEAINTDNGETCNSSMQLRHVHVNTLDIDNDGAAEIQVNQFVYDDIKNGSSSLTVLHTIDIHKMFTADGNTYYGRFDYDNSAMDVGDLNKDNKQDIVFFSPATRTVQMWGNNAVNPDDVDKRIFGELGVFDTRVTDSNNLRPIVLTANIDNDSLTLQYNGNKTETDSAYRLVFTKPIIIAVLAAPPCSAELAQDESACTSSFGTGESENINQEHTWNSSVAATAGFSAGVSVGVEFEAEVTGTVTASYAKTAGSAYSLTTSVTYTTGGNEDSVVFTTIPYDQYTYTILTHLEPELIGKEIVVSLPRSPITILTKRDFYNEHIDTDGIKIDSSIFGHSVGQPHSYPSPAAVERIKKTVAKDNTVYKSKKVDVGQGSGSTTADVVFSREIGEGSSYGVEVSLDVSTTLGSVVAGFTIGGGEEDSLSISHGQSFEYSGTVSQIDSDDISDAYSYGLFTYIQTPASQPEMQFEVINYWVE